MKILKALNYIYSLRHLESVMDISYQNLWKYVNMLSIPSDEVANDIISKLNELKVVDKTIADFAEKYRGSVHRLASDIGFLSLYVLKVEDHLRDLDVDMVLPLSEHSVPFATILSWELGIKICVPVFGRKVRDPRVKVVWYFSQPDNELELFLLPRLCTEEGSNVLLADIAIDDVEKLKAIVQLLRSSDMDIKGVVTVYLCKECLDYIGKNITQSTYYVLVV